MALGLKYGRQKPDDIEARDRCYPTARAYYGHFKEKFVSAKCIDIQGHNLLDKEEAARFQTKRHEICNRVV